MYIYLYIFASDTSPLSVGNINEIELLNSFGFDKHRFVSKAFLRRNQLEINTVSATATISKTIKKEKANNGLALKNSNIIKKKKLGSARKKK